MALQTLGTSGTSILGLVWTPTVPQSDVAIMNASIYDDYPNNQVYFAYQTGAGGFVREGLLYVPNRGFLTLYPGDVIATDQTSGAPFLLTAYGLSAGPWALTPL
jgi:hypothetical protein